MYQAFKLIVVGSICLSVFIINHLVLSNKNKKDNYFWIGLTIVFLLMGFDEAAEIHETLPYYIRDLIPAITSWYESLFQSFGFQSSIWIIYVLPFFPLGVAWVLYILKNILKQYGKRLIPLVLGTCLFFVGAFGFEFIGTLDEVFFSQRYETVLLFEEMFEMVGGTVLVFFGFSELKMWVNQVKVLR